MVDKTCLVTGATSGIGYETALGLAKLGATVIITARDSARGIATLERIKAETTNPEVHLFLVDFASLQSVRDFTDSFLSKYDRLHVLINNAGAALKHRTLTVDGFECVFQVNQLAPFLLTNLLLPTLMASAPARIVTVASDAHRTGHIDFENLMSEKRYGPWYTYANSKLANVMFSMSLAEKLQATTVTSNALHPGAVKTNIGKESLFSIRLIYHLFGPIMLTPKEGAKTSIYLATSPEVNGLTGGYYAKCKPAKLNPEVLDRDLRSALWDRCAEMVGLV